MKIGIISSDRWLERYSNYGTLFQNYALQTFLRSHGHETFWILTRGEISAENLLRKLLVRARKLLVRARENPADALSHAFHFCENKIRYEVFERRERAIERRERAKISAFDAKHPRHFSEFFEKNVPHTERRFSESELLAFPPKADAYIVGSDQCWGEVNATSFLGFGEKHARRIAYAVSTAWKSRDENWIERARTRLPAFSAVSVREPEGVEICRRAGREDVQHVADPTLLLSRENYMQLVRDAGRDVAFPRKTVLAYFLNVKSRKQLPWRELLDFARERDADLKVVPLQGAELAVPEKFVFAPSPAEWLNAFDKAECILTNSFHGTVFAIIMRKPFLTVVQSGKTAEENCRFYSVLRKLGLESRIYNRGIGGGVWKNKCSQKSIGKRFRSVSAISFRIRKDLFWTRSRRVNFLSFTKKNCAGTSPRNVQKSSMGKLCLSGFSRSRAS